MSREQLDLIGLGEQFPEHRQLPKQLQQQQQNPDAAVTVETARETISVHVCVCEVVA